MLTPEQQETLKARLDALGVQPEKPRNWKPYIQIESDFYDVAEVLAATLGAIDEPSANGADEIMQMLGAVGIRGNQIGKIYQHLVVVHNITSLDGLTPEWIDELAELDGVGMGTVTAIQTYIRERQAQA